MAKDCRMWRRVARRGISCRADRPGHRIKTGGWAEVPGEKGFYLKDQLKGKLIEHKQYIDKHCQDMPEIRNWKWSSPK